MACVWCGVGGGGEEIRPDEIGNRQTDVRKGGTSRFKKRTAEQSHMPASRWFRGDGTRRFFFGKGTSQRRRDRKGFEQHQFGSLVMPNRNDDGIKPGKHKTRVL